MSEYSKEMANYVKSWGLPECLAGIKEDIIFKFDDNNLCDTNKQGYRCEKNNVKFCLYNTKLKKVLFSMDFQRINRCAFKDPIPRVQLHLIYTHIDAFRRKGIASYYISKLIEYAICQNAKCISLTANADVDNNYNALEQNELELFYEKRSTDDMPIIFYASR